ncbi:MAG TPA: TIGR02266 family protein [Polyangia bacterium]|nr:TIGR02266 family protein [Polyangia bacterium]
MDQPPSKEPRGPVSLRIKFRSATLDQFIERYAVDVSRGGIFIRTREPLPVGTQLRFDFQLQDAAPLLAGEGTIVWIRENDPTRAGATPGMGVRFDKLTPASQPVLEKILADKARREQAGAPAKPGPAGGMAVRQPSSTFSTLDPASARAAQAVSGPPRVGGLSPLGAQPRVPASATGSGPLGAQPRSRAPGTGSGPVGAQPRAAAPNVSSGPIAGGVARTTEPAIDADPFGVGRSNAPTTNTSRTAETAIPGGLPPLEGTGPFGRPRSTTGMNAQRPAPAPSALFEKPTADDIDRALSVLTEVEGPAPVPAAVPVDFSSRIRRPTDAQPMVVESAPDVGGAPKAAHRRPTDAQPVVLESAADVGDAPSRRTGTRPMFTGTGEMKVPTIPVVPLGDSALEGALRDEEEEDGATTAWVGSGPTRVGGAGTDPEMPVVSEAAATANKVDLPKVSAPTPLPLGVPAAFSVPAEPPRLIAESFAPPKPARPATTKSGSGATVAVVGLLLAAAAGGGYYVLKSPGRSSSPAAPVPTATTEATKPAATPEATPSATGAVAPTPSAAAAPEQPTPAEKPAGGGTATPGSLRARPESEAPNAASGEAKPAEGAIAAQAKPGEAKASDAKPAEAKPESKPPRGGHKAKRRAAAAEAAPPAEAPPAVVADVSPPAPAADAPPKPAAEAPAKAASSDHILKIASTPGGAEVIVDGNSVGTTPFSAGDVDPALPHSVTIKKEGFEAYEHMIGGSDWPRPKNGVRTLKLNAKLRSTGGGGEAAKPAASEAPAEPPPGLGTTPASPKRE